MTNITQYLEIYTKQYLLDLALQQIPSDVDSRQGSIIYDTLAIVCGKLADTFMEVKKIADQAYMKTATVEENIDYRAEERGITREQATQAERLGVFTFSGGVPATVPIGALFCTIDENKQNVVNYQVISPYTVDGVEIKGSYILRCQTFGTIGNNYFGEILPLSDMDTLDTATLTTVLVPARDKETSESVKQRYYETFNMEAFGGNLADYRQYMREFTGVGQTQIYPRTRDDYKIILSCVDPSNQPISLEYQDTIRQTLDPENFYNNGNDTSGMGLGVVPMGHYVTVMAPEKVFLDIELTVILKNTGYLPTVLENITNNINAYIKQIQDNWSDGSGQYEMVVYYNQILSSAISAEGVLNISECTVNGGTEDITMEQTREKQYIPFLGTLNVSEQ